MLFEGDQVGRIDLLVLIDDIDIAAISVALHAIVPLDLTALRRRHAQSAVRRQVGRALAEQHRAVEKLLATVIRFAERVVIAIRSVLGKVDAATPHPLVRVMKIKAALVVRIDHARVKGPGAMPEESLVCAVGVVLLHQVVLLLEVVPVDGFVLNALDRNDLTLRKRLFEFALYVRPLLI